MVRRFIEDAGNTSQSLGVGRVLGQLFAYLYFSPEPKNLAEMQEALGISKGSASTGVRQLEQWGAVKKIWIKGDRKDYYQANDWLGKILKKVILDVAGKKMASYKSFLEEVEAGLPEMKDEDSFVRERIEHLRRFHNRAQKLWESALVKIFVK